MDKLRMCIVCRQMKDKRELIRVVKSKEGELSIDLTGKKNGRGAYVCRDKDCIVKLKKQKSFNKAFKQDVSDEIYKLVEEETFGIK